MFCWESDNFCQRSDLLEQEGELLAFGVPKATMLYVPYFIIYLLCTGLPTYPQLSNESKVADGRNPLDVDPPIANPPNSPNYYGVVYPLCIQIESRFF